MHHTIQVVPSAEGRHVIKKAYKMLCTALHIRPRRRKDVKRLSKADFLLFAGHLSNGLVVDVALDQPRAAVHEATVKKTSRVGSDAYECPNCGQRNVEYNQLQTRSADEAMTAFCRCIECKHRWKE
jgi:DNA-directed RNA polymerase subunit M/transcription elongation factor TFIIS